MPVCADFEGGKCAISLNELFVTFCSDAASKVRRARLSGFDARPAKALDSTTVVRRFGGVRDDTACLGGGRP